MRRAFVPVTRPNGKEAVVCENTTAGLKVARAFGLRFEAEGDLAEFLTALGQPVVIT